jgi:hypothetical protein
LLASIILATVTLWGRRDHATAVATLGGNSCIISLNGAFLNSGVEVNRSGEDEKWSAGEQEDGGDMHVARER